MPHALGRRVRDERQLRRWSQERLAGLVGVTCRTIGRLERSAHRPTSHLVQALERVLDLHRLVPGWKEAADPADPSYGPRVRALRVATGLTLAEAAHAAGVSASTLSRFEREVGSESVLAGTWDTSREGICNDGLARALGFRDAAELNRHCRTAF